MTCPHGMPSPASCVSCMDDGPVVPPEPCPPPVAEVSITASYAGRCADCCDPIEPGDQISMVSDLGWCCTECTP